MSRKIKEVLKILIDLGVPKGQQNERTALCLLALVDIKKNSRWVEAKNPLIGITPMMDYARKYYQKEYAPNSRETFRRFSMHQLVEGGIALYNPDDPKRPVNSPNAVYQISPDVLEVIKRLGTTEYEKALKEFNKKVVGLAKRYSMERKTSLVPVKINNKLKIKLSPGEHSRLIKDIIEQFAPRFLRGADLLYVGDTGEKWGYYDQVIAKALGILVDEHGKMPDVIFYISEKRWLVLVESVTSHGPVDSKRHIELNKLVQTSKLGKVFVTAFPNKQLMAKYLSEIAWETEVWVADNPTHMIHFKGERFLGPYK
jgi:BsuBI/PstI restriction endonuclease domain/BsuBI/PstI restriction endonuclease HTH domain